MKKKRKLLIVAAVILVIVVLNSIIFEHRYKFTEVYSFDKPQEISEDMQDLYWFTVSDFDNGLIDTSPEQLKKLGIDPSDLELDTSKYTYIVTLGYDLVSLKTSFWHCSLRKEFPPLMPKEYIGITTLKKSDKIKIYRIRKTNVMYYYHGSNDPKYVRIIK
ncbi:MAG TPA: hypothetical protein DCY31_07630 [Ruminococcaceae bacterium]|nr:hypothetical protein [Oscillospiraceae bacterium]